MLNHYTGGNMAKEKNSFVLYTELIETVDELTNEQAGVLFKHILRYVNDQNPDAPDEMTRLLFIPIRQNLKRDLKKWESIRLRNSLNGQKGGRPKKTEKTQWVSEKPKKPVNVNVNVNDIKEDSFFLKMKDKYGQ